jgi:hypothetical protein
MVCLDWYTLSSEARLKRLRATKPPDRFFVSCWASWNYRSAFSGAVLTVGTKGTRTALGDFSTSRWEFFSVIFLERKAWL